MYKTFAKDSGEAYRQHRQQRQHHQGGSSVEVTATTAAPAAAAAAGAAMASPKFVGMHAARCFLGALSGYSGSGWLAAEEYACTVLPTELRALQRPVAALQLYVRLVAAAAAARRTSVEGSGGGGGSGALGGASTHSQQQQQQQQKQKLQKRASRETNLLLALEDLCWRYPDAARVAARAWERGRESSKLDMSFFPITARAGGPPPPSRQRQATTPQSDPPPRNNADPLGIDFDSREGEAPPGASAGGGGVGEKGAGRPSGGGGGVDAAAAAAPAVTKGVGEGVVFEGLSLPGVVHEETRAVDTENASVEASIKVATGATSWAHEMADSLKAELAAAEAVQAGKGPWLTLSASYAHQAGTSSRWESHGT
ncbi:unnamed protein product [Hapterophycus canaliculatus]